MTIYFTSDTHFWHRQIIQYCNRPANSVEEMNELLIQKWNEKVKPKDEIYHLGDFFFCGSIKAGDILKRLNGRKHWIKGNHDAPKETIRHYFESIHNYRLIRVPISYLDEEEQEKTHVQPIVLFHFPILSWDGMAHGSWHLHGHCHGSLPDNGSLRLDVGVDCWGMAPVSLEEITQAMALRTVVPVDHHDRRENNPRFTHLLKKGK